MDILPKIDYKKQNFIFDKQTGCWNIEDESIYFDIIKYNFPDNAGCTPFSRNLYYHHFIDASGFTFLGEYDDFKNPYKNEKVQAVIPMGYKSILIFERAYLYENGELILERNLPRLDDTRDTNIGKYVVHSNKLQKYYIPSWKDDLITYQIKVNSDDKLSTDTMEDVRSAQKIAKEFSLKENSRCIVSRIIEFVSWH
ncbi:MAG: hypothetical protein LLG02_03105 [Pelosinus sp.]|nr:hypothetical protein [Pelosinus sp.]